MIADKTNHYQNWNNLAAAAQAGDKRAYQQLIKELIPYARAVLSGALAHADWADDVVQDMLISMHKALPTYDPERSFKAWVTTILYYRKADFLRKVYASKSQENQSFDDMVEKNSAPHVTIGAHHAEYTDIEKALGSIPDKPRAIFILSRLEGYSAKEVAKIKNMSVSAVKVSVHRTAKRLKEILR
jgi:RNA polymerase sigma-70 factor (ECF subfamily)|tara:strand:+ start:50454 stop:51011 length:558 start_codon:yes stop_codon:yes gene_type:complete